MHASVYLYFFLPGSRRTPLSRLEQSEFSIEVSAFARVGEMRKRGCVLVTLLGNGDGKKKKPIPRERERNPYEVATFRGPLVDEAKLHSKNVSGESLIKMI